MIVSYCGQVECDWLKIARYLLGCLLWARLDERY